jgi:hypothetical protein
MMMMIIIIIIIIIITGKLQNYADVKEELNRTWKLNAIFIIPLVSRTGYPRQLIRLC